jgi:hypothetical protein
VAERIARIHARLDASGDFAAASKRASDLFDFVLAFEPLGEAQTFSDAAYTRRMLGHLAACESATAKRVYPILRDNPTLARTLAFLIRPTETPQNVYGLLAKLQESDARACSERPALVAAICVVHDQPLRRQINENSVTADEPADLLGYYLKHERRMLFGIRNVPAELLVWVVDTTAHVKEMRWALQQYGGDRNVGRHFHTIEYDYDHLKHGRPKRISRVEYNLPNIRQYGGVCADQAYFASQVGKAIGVPTAYVVGRSGQTGHAWVGFLQARRGKARWNFDVGRYAGYQGVRGVVRDPQTRQRVSDSYVSLLGELVGADRSARHASTALTDAARRLNEFAGNGGRFSPPNLADGEASDRAAAARAPETATQLRLVREALSHTAGNADAWYVVRDLAEADRMSLAQKKTWAEALQRMTGRKYPDFTMDILVPMIRTVEDAEEQNRLWEAAFRLVQRRQDLAAEIRVEQGMLWAKQGEPSKAGRAYEDVLRRFPNAGPFVIDALQRTDAMLRQAGRGDRALELYRSTWHKIDRPPEMAAAFAVQSNWYRVGMLYASKLEAAGNAREAKNVRDRIKEQMEYDD